MAGPRSIRFDSPVEQRLTSYVARHPGSTVSSTAARFVDEGLRMQEHPGVLFRDGAVGRRATLVGGPDVWEVVRAVRSARAAESQLSESELFELVSENSGVPVRLIRTAVTYWATYPAEVDSLLDHADESEISAAEAAVRARVLLTG